MEKKCTCSVAWLKSHLSTTTENQDLATTAISLDIHRKTARTLPGAHGVHKKDTTVAS